MELIVTADIANRAIQFGACRAPRPGTTIEKLNANQLSWAARNKLLTDSEMEKLPAPIWALAISGNGDGYGDGDGYGNGYGDGYGDGYGYGNGYGDGYGDGDGDG